MKLSRLIEAATRVYHGTSKPHDLLKAPIFVATDRDAALYYAEEQTGDQPGVILYGSLNVVRPLSTLTHGADAMLDIARKAKIKFTERPYFHCDAIAKHSDYDGGNLNDLVYVPAFVKALKAEGYDSLHTHDVLTNEVCEVYVLFDAKQFIIEGHDVVDV